MSLSGIDISAWQSDLNIASVPGDFVITKTTEGTSYVNRYADSQIQSTLKCGKLMGFYHFASKTGNATAEANYFVDQSRGYFGKGIAVLDWEEGLERGAGWCKTFLDRVYALTGVRCLIYMSKSVSQQYDWSSISKDYGLWGAMYADQSPTAYQPNPYDSGTNWGSWGKNLTIRQYTDNGRLPGYSSSLDLNIAYLDKNGWRALSTGKASTDSILGEDEDMNCYLNVKGAGWPMMYYDGRTMKPLSNTAELDALKSVYKTATGRDMAGKVITKSEYLAIKAVCDRGASTYK